MTSQNLVQKQIELKTVKEYLNEIEQTILKNNPSKIYRLPLENSKGNFQGFFDLDDKVDSSYKKSSESININLTGQNTGSSLLPIVTGG